MTGGFRHVQNLSVPNKFHQRFLVTNQPVEEHRRHAEGGKKVRLGKWCVRSVRGSSGRVKWFVLPYRQYFSEEQSSGVKQLPVTCFNSTADMPANQILPVLRVCQEGTPTESIQNNVRTSIRVQNSHVDRLHGETAKQVEMEFKILPISCEVLHSQDPSIHPQPKTILCRRGPYGLVPIWNRVVLISLSMDTMFTQCSTGKKALSILRDRHHSAHALYRPQDSEHQHSPSSFLWFRTLKMDIPDSDHSNSSLHFYSPYLVQYLSHHMKLNLFIALKIIIVFFPVISWHLYLTSSIYLL